MELEVEGVQSLEVVRVAGLSSPSCAETSFRELDDAFLQTQTRIWLGEVLQLRLDDQISISEVLADGELLFEVSKVVWSLLLERHTELRHEKAYENEPFASKKSSGRYMPYSNVDSFLKICKIFGLTGVDLFSPSDVVEKRNTRRVCMCIRFFSKKARSQDLNVPDFDVVTYTVAMPTDMVGSLRRSLELSQSSLRGVSTLHDGARKKFWQNFVSAERSGAEVSDGSEFGNVSLQHDSLVSSCVNDTLSCVNSSSEGSVLSPILINDDGESFPFQSDAKREDQNEYPDSIFRMYCENKEKDNEVSNSSSSSIYLSTGLKSEASSVEAIDQFDEENGYPSFSYTDHDLECSPPVLENVMYDNTPVGGRLLQSMVISDSMGIGNILSDGEGSMCCLQESASSCGSNLFTRNISIGKELITDGDNMDIRFASAMNLESGDVLSPKEYFEVNGDKIQDIHFFEPKCDYDSFYGENSGDKIECRTSDGRFQDENIVHYNVGHGDGDGDGEVQFSGITSFHCPDHELLETGCQGDICSYNSGLSQSQVISCAADKDKTYRTDSGAANDVGCVESKKLQSYQCHSTSDLVDFVKEWPYDKSSSISSKYAVSSTVSDDDTEQSKQQKNYDLAIDGESCIHGNRSHVPSYVKRPECSSNFYTDDADEDEFDGFQLDISPCKEVVTEVAVPLKQLKRTASMESCLTDESSESISQSSNPSCAHSNSTLYYAEINEYTSVEHVACSNNELEEKVNTSDQKVPQGKSHKKLLLRSVLGGTAAFGLICLLLHRRKSNDRSTAQVRTGKSSIRPNDTDKVEGTGFSSHKDKGQMEKRASAKGNGLYPAQKLKFGF